MNTSSFTRAALVAMLLALPAGASAAALDSHDSSVDGVSNLLSWVTPQENAYDHVMFLSWDLLLNRIPVDPVTGVSLIAFNSEYDATTFSGTTWPNNPAGKNAMLSDAARMYYAYSGNGAVVTLVRSLLDHQLNYGTTPDTCNWPRVPWSTAAAGSVTYGNDALREGAGVLEPDKLGELGYHGYLWMYEVTGNTVYRDAAIQCADVLVSHLRAGTSTQSPWPFRVSAESGAVVENYCSDVIAPIRLFDELIRLNLGNVAGYQTTRAAAWSWLMNSVIPTNSWYKYFEDVGVTNALTNSNQYNAGQTARYLLEHPETDPSWQTHVSGIMSWIQTNFGGTDNGELGLQFGARVISEQQSYKYKMASHTSRFAAVKALYSEATGDATAKDVAFRTLNWCTYMCRSNGVVIEGPAEDAHDPTCWFTDGHGDYVRHFMIALGAFPEWAPTGESHLLRSSSVVRSVSYVANTINYVTFDAASTEVLRVSQAPASVTADGAPLASRQDLAQQGWTYNASTGVLRVRHDDATAIRVVTGAALGVGPPRDAVQSLLASPNPSQGTVRIAFVIPRPARVEIAVCDVAGRLVRNLSAGPLAAGPHEAAWDGKDASGQPVSPGVYQVRLKGAGMDLSTRIVRVE